MKLEEMTKDQLIDLARKQEVEMLAARQPLADSFVAPGVTVDTPEFAHHLRNYAVSRGTDMDKQTRSGLIAHIDAHTARAVAASLEKERASEMDTIRDRDQYHEWADKLADAIAKYFERDIGEHSNVNCPWAEALDVIEEAEPMAAQPVAGELPPLPDSIAATCTACGAREGERCRTRSDDQCDAGRHVTQPVQQPAAVGIKPDPAHLIALALSGALPDQQAGEILSAAYGQRTAPVPAAGVQGDVSVLRSVLEVVRQYPDFDGGTPFGMMIDEALAGKVPTLLSGINNLSAGRKPQQPDSGRYAALAVLLRECLGVLESVPTNYVIDLASRIGTALAAHPAPSSDAVLLTALKDIAEACNCCGDRHDLAQIAQDALDATIGHYELSKASQFQMMEHGLTKTFAAHPANGAQAGLSDAARDVLAERRRQIEKEGFGPAGDDEYAFGELRSAALCYISGDTKSGWPWDKEWWKPTDDRHDLIKAGALVIAEIERLDRLAAAKKAAAPQKKEG